MRMIPHVDPHGLGGARTGTMGSSKVKKRLFYRAQRKERAQLFTLANLIMIHPLVRSVCGLHFRGQRQDVLHCRRMGVEYVLRDYTPRQCARSVSCVH